MKLCDTAGMCDHLEKRVNLSRVGNGLQSVTTLHFDTNEVTWKGVMYIHNRDKGTVLNFCPFCGGKPGPWANRDNAKDDKA